MANIEIENRIQELEPQFLQALSDYLDYLFFLQEKRLAKNGTAIKHAAKTEKAAETAKPDEEIVTERLRIARQFKGIASKTASAEQATPANTAGNRLEVLEKYFDSFPKPHFPVSKYDVYEQ